MHAWVIVLQWVISLIPGSKQLQDIHSNRTVGYPIQQPDIIVTINNSFCNFLEYEYVAISLVYTDPLSQGAYWLQIIDMHTWLNTLWQKYGYMRLCMCTYLYSYCI